MNIRHILISKGEERMIENEIEVGKIYQNIKNGKLYRVEGIGKFTEPPMELETMVFYKAMYPDNQPYWVMPYWIFKEKFKEWDKPIGTVNI